MTVNGEYPPNSNGILAALMRTSKRLRYPALLLLFTIAVFWKIFLTKEYSILTFPDSAMQSYPWYQYIVRCLRARGFPFWDPFVEAGRSFIGEVQTAAFYPINWLMALVPLNSKNLVSAKVIEHFAILHCFLASALAYLLARYFRLSRFSSFVAGLVFGLSGSVGLRVFAQINVSAASVWIPGVFCCFFQACASKAWKTQLFFSSLGGAALALSLLAGHHQPFIYCSVALLFVVAYLWLVPSAATAAGISNRGTMLWVLPVLFAFALALSSLQLFPALEYSKYSYRWISEPYPIPGNAAVPYSVAGNKFSFPPSGLLNLVFPFFFQLENSPYFGIVPLLLVLFSFTMYKKSVVVRLWLLLGLIFLILSLGSYTPLHGILYVLVPGFNKARETSRALLIVHLAVGILAGFGCDAFFAQFTKKSRAIIKRVILAFTTISLLISTMVFTGYFWRTQVLGQSANFNTQFVTCILLLIASVLALSRYYGIFTKNFLKVGLVLVCLADYHFFLNAQIRPRAEFDKKGNFEPSQYFELDKIVSFLRSQHGVFRIDFRNDLYPQNIGEVYGLDTVNGHAASAPTDFMRLFAGGGNVKVSGLYNVKYVVSNAVMPLPVVFEDRGIRIYENPHFLPRVWLAETVLPKLEVNQVLTAVRMQSADLGHIAYIEEPAPALHSENFSPNTPEDVAVYSRLGVNRFSVEAESQRPKLLVVSESWYPGWTAKVNSKRTRIWRVDGGIMGVYLEPGRSTVEFLYRPTHFWWQVGITFAGILILGILGLLSLPHRRMNNSADST